MRSPPLRRTENLAQEKERGGEQRPGKREAAVRKVPVMNQQLNVGVPRLVIPCEPVDGDNPENRKAVNDERRLDQ